MCLELHVMEDEQEWVVQYFASHRSPPTVSEVEGRGEVRREPGGKIGNGPRWQWLGMGKQQVMKKKTLVV